MQTTIRPIRTPEEHDQALGRIEELMAAEPGTPEFDELEVLGVLVHAYETVHEPILPPTPIEAIRFRMDQMGLEARDLEPLIGPSGRVSEVLNGRRNLTIRMIRKLHSSLKIPAEVLIRDPGTRAA
jgi:HTH-type transcriptional regulator/antitoxin HigA